MDLISDAMLVTAPRIELIARNAEIHDFGADIDVFVLVPDRWG